MPWGSLFKHDVKYFNSYAQNNLERLNLALKDSQQGSAIFSYLCQNCSYLYSAFCQQTQFVLKDLKNNIKSKTTNNIMSSLEDIHDRVYRHFKANLEVKDPFLSCQIYFLLLKSSVGKSFLPSERQRSVHHGWIKKHAGFVFN